MSHEFCFRFFSWIIFPQASDNNILNFLKNSRRYLEVKVHHRYQRHRRQICYRYQWHRQQICHQCHWHQRRTMGTLSDADTFKWTWRKKFIYMLTLLLKGVPKINLKFSDFKLFFDLLLVSTTPVIYLKLRISPRIFENIRNYPNGILYSGAGGTWFMKKT